MLVLYGASYLPKSLQVAKAICNYLTSLHPHDNAYLRTSEAIYLSDDRTIEEFENFMRDIGEERAWLAVPWRDDRLIEVK